MSLRAIVTDKAFRYLVLTGAGVAVANLVTTYLKNGQVDVAGSVIQFTIVGVIAVPLVGYWNFMDRRAERE
ncbi:hypothetical protein C440_12099 [Haloferax mucosum ATCC BAA-1512]|uniref:Uncharacterized protein n=1 Tax=Haloferax mucosum ATCC BAA-1512 TaxID=662479 RepID=M0IBP0_9EURY|nr:hypothetical protein [Haloferax mucosum]ELZ92859.1 hypothetical protein C440_12099 [Haloferax mucosum ATCC BAA-1512]